MMKYPSFIVSNHIQVHIGLQSTPIPQNSHLPTSNNFPSTMAGYQRESVGKENRKEYVKSLNPLHYRETCSESRGEIVRAFFQWKHFVHRTKIYINFLKKMQIQQSLTNGMMLTDYFYPEHLRKMYR